MSNGALAVVFLFFASALLVSGCRILARRSRHPIAVWGAGAYLGLLHLIAIGGLLTSRFFESGLPSLTLLTFPWSMSLYDESTLSGFGTLPDMVANYLRYIVGFGSLNAGLIVVFLAVVTGARSRAGIERVGAGSPTGRAAS